MLLMLIGAIQIIRDTFLAYFRPPRVGWLLVNLHDPQTVNGPDVQL